MTRVRLPDRRPTMAIQRYDASRSVGDRTSICNAPFTNLYFAATGKAASCWMDISESPESWSHDRSILDIWHGEFLTGQRRALAARRFSGPCRSCLSSIEGGASPLAAVYDRLDPEGDRPISFELELSNLCNFACQMCHGELSSKIRRERDHLPPLHSPYDDLFVEQLSELLPHTRDLRFSGGEPMLQPIVHEIAKRVADLRPDLPINVSTNGSTINARVREMLSRSEVRLFLSFESLRPEIYESIRIGSDFAALMANIDEFDRHFRDHPGGLVITTNPMRANWPEMADFVNWSNRRGFALAFNTVVQPERFSLRTLPPDDLRHVRDTMASAVFEIPADANVDLCHDNERAYRAVVAQLEAWLDAGEASETAPR